MTEVLRTPDDCFAGLPGYPFPPRYVEVTAEGLPPPATRGWETVFQERVPGARGRRHVTIDGAGHFLQEDAGERLGEVIADVIATDGL